MGSALTCGKEGSWPDLRRRQGPEATGLPVVRAAVRPVHGFFDEPPSLLLGLGPAVRGLPPIQHHAGRISAGSSERAVHRLLRTRHWWLLAFGLVHAALLWQGDILGPYGLLGLLLVPLFLHRSDRTLTIWIGVLLGVAALGNLALAALGQLAPAGAGAMALQQQAAAEPSYLVSVLLRLALWVPTPISSLAGLVMPAAFLIGTLAARHRVL